MGSGTKPADVLYDAVLLYCIFCSSDADGNRRLLSELDSIVTEIVTDVTVPVLNQYGQQVGTTSRR
jgi:hypothetical protein